MKKSAIKELYYGNCTRFDSLNVSKNYKKLSDKNSKSIDRLSEVLNEEQKKLLNEIVDTEIEIGADWAELNFIEGVKLGLRLGTEAFDSDY